MPLVALVLLALNDHLWKGAGVLPAWLTGKLSDFAGLLFFPLLLSALGDTLLCFVARATGWRVDFSLRRWKVIATTLLTAGVFVPLELSASYGRFYVDSLGKIGFPSQTTADLGDLWALLMLPVAAWLGFAEIRRVPLGRLEVIARALAASPSPTPASTARTIEALLGDLPEPARLAAPLAAWHAGGPEAPVAAELTRRRG